MRTIHQLAMTPVSEIICRIHNAMVKSHLLLRVTPEDILKGIRMSAKGCPIAQSYRRTVREFTDGAAKHGDNDYPTFTRAGVGSSYIWDNKNGVGYCWALNHKAKLAMAEYDRKEVIIGDRGQMLINFRPQWIRAKRSTV